ncbi:uncharacterized protein MEPE_02580 [Melanopsichium pennsylvanicum]|uniref:Uncharacterized protein n=1 Tax=Melanopsichium pennsylvanicum TaxID=63383 RepID=A0AAJ4XKB3_9BASI|nr:uncharacterized protein MEPE_02580 [Melanopsichium pennsylvanicum]
MISSLSSLSWLVLSLSLLSLTFKIFSSCFDALLPLIVVISDRSAGLFRPAFILASNSEQPGDDCDDIEAWLPIPCIGANLDHLSINACRAAEKMEKFVLRTGSKKHIYGRIRGRAARASHICNDQSDIGD